MFIHFVQMKRLLLRLWHVGPTSLLNKNLPQPLQRLLNVFLRKQAKRSAHIGRFLPAGEEHSSRQCEYTMLISLCLDHRLGITSVWKEKFEPKKRSRGCQRSDVRRLPDGGSQTHQKNSPDSGELHSTSPERCFFMAASNISLFAL